MRKIGISLHIKVGFMGVFIAPVFLMKCLAHGLKCRIYNFDMDMGI